MYDVLRTSVLIGHSMSAVDTAASSLEPDPADPWLFTDPVAKAAYAYTQRLEALREDIQTNIMFDGRWASDELILKYEVARLLDEGRLIAKGSFGYVSPHSTVYRAVTEGALQINGEAQLFRAGDDIVFVPWLLRVSHPGQSGPGYISHLHSVTTMCLCCDAYLITSTWCERSRTILHNILYPANRTQGMIEYRPNKHNFQSGDHIMVKDPVCGMQVDPKTAAATSTYEGQHYYFCASYCKKKFDLNPAHYAGKAPTNNAVEQK